MNKKLIFSFLFLLGTLSIFAQNRSKIYENLHYVNEQFSKYNEYNTSWSVDFDKNLLTCTDKFGSLTGNIRDVEIRFSSDAKTTIGFYCMNPESECLKGTGDTDYSKYTMGLNDGGTAIYEAEVVVQKLTEIKQLMLSGGGNSGGGEASRETKAKVDEIVDRVNDIFSSHSTYKNRWRVDWSQMLLIGATKSCEVHVALGKDVTITPYNRTSSMGYFFESSSKQLREKCTSFDEYKEKTYEYLDTRAAADEVIDLFTEVLNTTKNIGGGGNSGGSGVGKANELADRLTSIFASHSKYKNSFRIDWDSKKIIWNTPSCEIIVPVSSGTWVEYYERDSYKPYVYGFKFHTSGDDITEGCTSFNNKTATTIDFVDNQSDGEEVVRIFKELIQMMK